MKLAGPSMRDLPLRTIIVGAATFIVFMVISHSELGERIENQIARRLEFRIREQIKRAPTLDLRIKIFSYDASTVDSLRKDDLSLLEWGTLFEAIGKQKPKIVLVDKLFRTPRGIDDSQQFVKIMQESGVNVVAGSYLDDKVAPNPNNIVSFQNTNYNLSKMAPKASVASSVSIDALKFLPITRGYMIGPEMAIQPGFQSIGHIRVSDFGLIQPFIRPDNWWAIPHWSLFVADSIKLAHESLIVNDTPINLNSRGLIVPNQMSREYLGSQSSKLLSLVVRSQRGMPIDAVGEGDVVIILPAMYPGHTDWVETPLERQEGGYLMTSMVNSVLKGEWLKPVGGEAFILLLACFIGSILGHTLKPVYFSVAVPALCVSIAGLGIGLFVLYGLIVPWLNPSLSLFVTGVLVFAEKAKATERNMLNLRQHLKGHLSTDRIEKIIKNPNIMLKEPVEKIVSIMFIDIVGFSTTAERQSPRDAFEGLKELFSLVRKIIYTNGGVIDKTLGDGLLAYFGYAPDGQQTAKGEHSDLALDSALRIQKEVLARNLQASTSNKAIYPLRIGINTASVHVGNVGDENTFDFTIIGNGVNFAKRLETACQHYCVMIGSTTFDTLTGRDVMNAQLTKRTIVVKGVTKPIEAYECDPFFDQQDLLRSANAAYQKSLGLERKEPRWPVQPSVNIILKSPFGDGKLIDFSHTGFAILLQTYIGNGVNITFNFVVEREIHEIGTTETREFAIIGEVRWGRPLEQGYLHGIMINNFSERQKEALVSVWREVNQMVTPTGNNDESTRPVAS
jgi:class 3 adenylate cyclase